MISFNASELQKIVSFNIINNVVIIIIGHWCRDHLISFIIVATVIINFNVLTINFIIIS